MQHTFVVENIKCGGCANTIRGKLGERFDLATVDVDVEQGRVTVDIDEAQRLAVAAALRDLGYPEAGTVEGFGSMKAKATSFVSCAIGRMDKGRGED